MKFSAPNKKKHKNEIFNEYHPREKEDFKNKLQKLWIFNCNREFKIEWNENTKKYETEKKFFTVKHIFMIYKANL